MDTLSDISYNKTLTYYILEEKLLIDVNVRTLGIGIGFQALVVFIYGWWCKSSALVVYISTLVVKIRALVGGLNLCRGGPNPPPGCLSLSLFSPCGLKRALSPPLVV